ncbi:MAG: KpsF/GutQ family sugar-phosphate isomerase [Bdellovibrionaceae bacterium]|nr:KpsF/GutQ family sugar-phosphate isomerase [Pseudobdellovibrionaceae bacterium]
MSSKIIGQGLRVLEVEAASILSLKSRIDDLFVHAVNMVVKTQGKVIVTGMGKSGHIARKLASTFSSTGTPAVYLHPAESSHGDLGIIGKDDLVLAISYGGETQELFPILSFVARKNIPLLAMTGQLRSTLAKAAAVVLNIHVPEEACPMGLAPTASTTAALALGDALAMAVLQEKGFTPEDFAQYHPGGSLGIKLLRVKDVMLEGKSIPLVKRDTPFREVITMMTHKDVRGSAGVLNEKNELIGIITDGDIRRRLEKGHNHLDGTAEDLMSHQPRTIDLSELAERALFMMEQFRIQTLYVLDKNSSTPLKPIGVLNFHELFKAKVR